MRTQCWAPKEVVTSTPAQVRSKAISARSASSIPRRSIRSRKPTSTWPTAAMPRPRRFSRTPWPRIPVARAFESAANELRSATGGRGAEWEKAASLGLSIDPTNPLYGGKPQSAGQGFMDTAQVPAFGGPAVTEPALEALNIDFDIGAAAGGGAQVPDIDLDAGTAGGGVQVPDIDLDAGTAGGGAQVPDINLDAGAPSSAGSAPAGLDFDLGLGGDKPAGGTTIAAPAQPAAASAAEPALSIDFDLPMGDKPAEAPAAAP